MATKKRARKQVPQRRNYTANASLRRGIQTRMRKLVLEFGGHKSFALHHGLDEKYIYRWTHQGMVPSSDTLMRMAVKSNISPTWVLVGRGNAYMDGQEPKAA